MTATTRIENHTFLDNSAFFLSKFTAPKTDEMATMFYFFFAGKCNKAVIIAVYFTLFYEFFITHQPVRAGS